MFFPVESAPEIARAQESLRQEETQVGDRGEQAAQTGEEVEEVMVGAR